MKNLYSRIGRYMFWAQKYHFPFGVTKLIIGHRGSSAIYPENTELSFAKAFEEGANAIELDVQKSSDNEYIVMHDSTVDRTTDYSGNVSDYTLSELTNMDAGNSTYNNRVDTKIPSLNYVLNQFGSTNIIVIHSKLGEIDTKNIIDICENKNILSNIIIFSNASILGNLKTYNQDIFVMNDSLPNDSNYESILNQAIEEKWDAISWTDEYITESMVQDIQRHNIEMHASYISYDFLNQTERLINLNVNYILGNDCLKMINKFKEFNLAQIKVTQ